MQCRLSAELVNGTLPGYFAMYWVLSVENVLEDWYNDEQINGMNMFWWSGFG